MIKLDCPPLALFILNRNAACVHPVLKFKLFIFLHSNLLLMSMAGVILGLRSYIFCTARMCTCYRFLNVI